MVEKISVQIALEGGAEVQRQLEGIGEAGQKAFDQIAKEAEQVGGFKNIKPEEVTQKLKNMGVEGVDAIEKIQKAVASAARLEGIVQGVQSVETAFATLGQLAGPILLGIGAAAVAAGKAMLAFADSVNQVNDAAAKAGLSLKTYDDLRTILLRAGISAEAVANGLQKLGQAAQKADVSKVADAFKQLQDAAERGFGAIGTKQLQDLQQAAGKAGEAGKQAREALVKLGQPIPTDIPKTLEELVQATGSAQAGFAAFIQQLQTMPDGIDRTNLALAELGDKLGVEVVGALKTGTLAAQQFQQASQGMITDEQVLAAARTREALNQLSNAWIEFKANVVAPLAIPTFQFLQSELAGIKAGIDATVQEFVALGAAINAVASVGATAIGAMVNAVVALGGAITQVVSAVSGITWSALDAGVAAWNAITQAIQGAIDAVLQFIGLKPQASAPAGGGGGNGGMAGGGIIGGRGSGTSDSNLAWVSRGEHIMPARAVAQPGVLAFLEALRRSGGNLRAVLNGMGRFALGGLVPRPAFAAGGPVGSMSHVTINFPGTPPISGLRASAEVVDQLQRAAALAQVRSGGRKPSRYS